MPCHLGRNTPVPLEHHKHPKEFHAIHCWKGVERKYGPCKEIVCCASVRATLHRNTLTIMTQSFLWMHYSKWMILDTANRADVQRSYTYSQALPSGSATAVLLSLLLWHSRIILSCQSFLEDASCEKHKCRSLRRNLSPLWSLRQIGTTRRQDTNYTTLQMFYCGFETHMQMEDSRGVDSCLPPTFLGYCNWKQSTGML